MRRTAAGILFAAWFACLLAGAARGGFSWGDGSSVVFGGTPIGIGKSTEDIAKTRAALVDAGLAKDAKQAELQVSDMQDRMLAALKLVKGKDAGVADTLKGMLRRGTLDVDLVKSAKTDVEGTTVSLNHDGILTPLVNVKSTLLLPPDGATFDTTALVSLALTLYHEGIHVRQEIPDVTETDAHRKEATQRRNTCKREIEAHGAELDVIKELTAAVKQLQANPDFVPGADASGFTKGVIEKLKPVDKKQLEKLIGELDRQTIGGTVSKNRYTTACAAYEKFLAGTLTWAQLQKAIADIGGGASTVFGPLNNKILLAPVGGIVFEFPDTGIEFLETPFEAVLSIDPVPEHGLLLVSGIRGELGGVVAYRDADGDGIFDPSTFTTVTGPTPALQSGLDLLDLGGETFFVTDVASGSIRRLVDGNGDGVPDTLGANIAAGVTIPDSFVSFMLAGDGTFYGFDAPLDTNPSFAGEEPTLRLSDTDGDGLFDEAGVAPFQDRLVVDPSVLEPLAPGATSARVHVTAGSDFWVLAVDSTTGYVRDVVAAGFAPTAAPVTVPLDSPVGADEGLVVHDFTHDVIGQATLAAPAGAAVRVTLTPRSATIGPGEEADFRALVTNDGLEAAHDVVLAFDVPPVVAWHADDPRCELVGGSVMCSLGDLAPGDAEVVHVTAPTDATDCGGALFVVAGAKDDEQAATISIDC